MRKIWLTILVSAVALSAISATVIYENDFTTRTSAMPLPNGSQWYETTYVPGKLMNRGDKNQPFNQVREPNSSQDGWLCGQNDCGANGYVIDVGGNQMAAIGTSGSTHLIMKHQIGNSFKTGWLELTIDVAAPETSGSNDESLHAARILLANDVFHRDEYALKSAYMKFSPFQVGIVNGATKKLWVRGGKDNALFDIKPATAVKGHWYRFIVTVNLDARRFWASIYDMGLASAGSPEISSQGNRVYDSSDAYPNGLEYYCDHATITAEEKAFLGLPELKPQVNDVTMLGLVSYYPKGGDNCSEPLNTARFDNVVIRHGATKETMEPYYVNDFSTCKFRRAKAGATSYTYTDSSGSTTVFNQHVLTKPYVSGVSLLAAQDTSIRQNAQPTGADQWRRLNVDGAGSMHINTNLVKATYAMLRATGHGTFAIGATPIGSAITSGTAIAQVDFRTPDEWDTTSGHISVYSIRMGLGDDRHYTSGYDNTAKCVGRAGLAGVSGTPGTADAFFPYYTVGTNKTVSGIKAVSEKGTALSGGTWYRAVMKADLDNQTFDYTLYRQGTDYLNCAVSSSPNGNEVYSETGIQFNDYSVRDITTVSLWAYGARNIKAGDENYYIYFDNLKVWSQSTGSTEKTLLYENLFSKRTLYLQTPEVRSNLIGVEPNSIDMIDQGQDEFVRRNRCAGNMFISKIGNDQVCEAAIGDSWSNYFAYAASPIGTNLTSGVLTASVDIRPPCTWYDPDNHVAMFTVGSSGFYQGNASTMGGRRNFASYRAVQFGFNKQSNGVKPVIALNRGNAAGTAAETVTDTTHTVKTANWYRFVSRIDLDRKKVELKVFNMGTDKPTLATATPAASEAVYATSEPQNLCSDVVADGGICSIGFYVNGTAYNPLDNSMSALFDNIRLTHIDTGMVIIIR